MTDSDSGVYIAVFFLAEARDISVGKLGRFRFRRGFYFCGGHLFYTPRLHSASVISSEVEKSGWQL